MKKLTTTQKQNYYNKYKKSNMYRLRDLYTSYSEAKAAAEQEIIEEMRKNGGYGYKVCGGNSCTFTCAYMYDTRENGDINKHLVYHTAYNRYDFIVEIKGD